MRIRSTSVFADKSFPLACMRIEDHAASPIHTHEFHELVVILTGHGRHVTDQEEYPIDAGDVFLVRGNMAHGYAKTDRMTLVNVMFDPKRLEIPMGLLRDLPGYQALFHVEPRLRDYGGFRSRLRVTEEELAEVAGQIARLQQELKRRDPGYRFQACAHLMSLIGFVSRCYSRSDRHIDRPLLRMGEVLSHIDRHYRERITLRQLVRVAKMSESTLMRTFRRVLGRSPIEHVIRIRVVKAAELLRQGDMRVTEAAFACGFSDSNYFSRQFRQVMGVSPRDYRTRYLHTGEGLLAASRARAS